MPLNTCERSKKVVQLFVSVVTVLVADVSVFVAPSFAIVEDQSMQAMTKTVVKHICNDGGAWLRCMNKPPSSCQQFAESVVQPCLSKNAGEIASAVTKESAERTAARLSKCINESLRERYQQEGIKTSGCRELPLHLR